jgi:predicted dehydrogenase
MAIRIGLVGCRGIGNTHAASHSNDPLAQLVAVCDVVKERADATAQKFGVPAYYKLSDMLRNEDLDMVDVTTGGYENGSWHFEPVMEALEARKNVLVEKPISNDIVEARQMVAKAREVDVYLGCNLNHYFTPTAERAMQYMREGQIGEVVYCLHKVGFNGGEEGYKFTPGPANRLTGWPYAHLKAFLAHPFACMRYFCGDITHVQAFLDRPGYRKHAGDTMISIASVNVRFANGSVGSLISQRGDAPWGLGGWWSLEVAGTRGTFCIENCIEKLYYWKAGGATMGTLPPTETLDTGIKDFGQTFPRRLHAYLEDVSNGVFKEDIRASGRDALATLEYTWAVMQSYESGGEMVRPHPLPSLHGDPMTLPG